MAGGVPSKTRGPLNYEPINLSLSFLLLLTQRAEVYAWAAARRLSWPVQSVRRDREAIKAFNQSQKERDLRPDLYRDDSPGTIRS